MSRAKYAVVKIDKDGNVLERYVSYSQAAARNNLNVRTIAARCKREMKQYEMIFDPAKCKLFTFRHGDDAELGDISEKPHVDKRVVMIDRMGRVVETYADTKEAGKAIGWSSSKVWRRCSRITIDEWARGEKVTFRWEGEEGSNSGIHL